MRLVPLPDWLRNPLARWKAGVARTGSPALRLDQAIEGQAGAPVGPVTPLVLMDTDGRLYASVIPVGTGTPTVALTAEIWAFNLATRDPLGRLNSNLAFTAIENSIDGTRVNSDSAINPTASFAFAATAAAGGTLADTAFLASPGAGLKWQIMWVGCQAVQAAGSAGDVVISDSVGSVAIGMALLWGRKQATAATALTISASGLAASSVIRVTGQARGVA